MSVHKYLRQAIFLFFLYATHAPAKSPIQQYLRLYIRSYNTLALLPTRHHHNLIAMIKMTNGDAIRVTMSNKQRQRQCRRVWPSSVPPHAVHGVGDEYDKQAC